MKPSDFKKLLENLEEWAWENHANHVYTSPYFKYSSGVIGKSLPAKLLATPTGKRILSRLV